MLQRKGSIVDGAFKSIKSTYCIGLCIVMPGLTYITIGSNKETFL